MLALTSTDPDRLPEEKARGMTIDLGFAQLTLSSPNGEIQVRMVEYRAIKTRSKTRFLASARLTSRSSSSQRITTNLTDWSISITASLGIRRAVSTDKTLMAKREMQ